VKNYDIGIIGGGISGIMCAYELVKHKTDLEICILKKGTVFFKEAAHLTKN
jgi:glycine/D-amino acid oxidase-like deaminating enzyme